MVVSLPGWPGGYHCISIPAIMSLLESYKLSMILLDKNNKVYMYDNNIIMRVNGSYVSQLSGL